LSPLVGRRVGAYEIQAFLGAGGMGEVYRARDTRLDRDVAIKFVHAASLGEPEARARFDREARSLSALDHPNICAVYDVGEHDGAPYLVMQFIEGETLASRLRKGALPFDQALRIAIEIAGALDAAHRRGIVHRDLKPGNVMLARASASSSSAPQAKLLDFGLAKVGPPAAASPGSTMTGTPPLTAPGTIVGTLQYMAPEQLEEKATDARTDIWAFGCVLYEMLTGRLAFEGDSRARLIGAILKDEPPPVSRFQQVAPPILDRVVETCLAKDVNDRCQSAHDLLLQLRWIVEGGSGVGVPAPVVTRRRWRTRVAWSAMVLLGLWGASMTYLAVQSWQKQAELTRPVRFTFDPPENTTFAQSAISPDGRRLAFIAADPQGRTQLWTRRIDGLAADLLPITEDAFAPFWSPDSQSIGFFTEGRAGALKRIDLAGGTPQTLCSVSYPGGGTWNRDGVILFTPNRGTGGLSRVNAAGGVVSMVTTLDASRQETSHRWPEFLPDGRHYLFYIMRGSQGEVALGELGSAEITHLFDADTVARYAAPGFLLTLRNGSVVAQAFDTGTGARSGDVFPIADRAGRIGTLPDFSVSGNGVLAWGPGSAATIMQPAWVDRAGKSLQTVGTPGDYRAPALSPDEKRLAFVQNDPQHGDDIWVLDVARGVSSRLTSDFRQATAPFWSPDGATLTFMANEGGRRFRLYQKTASGTDSDHLLFEPIDWLWDWSRDGRYALYRVNDPKTGYDLWVLPLVSNDRTPIPFVTDKYAESDGAFSPDHQWIAYTSDDTGRPEVYVQPFPTTGSRVRISTAGGFRPSWRSDGLELYYIALGDMLTSVTLGAGATRDPGSPRALFHIQLTFSGLIREYVPGRGGQRFLVMLPARSTTPAPMTVLVNWLAAAKR
jgi:Tol biopolymer transport system component